MHYFPGSFEQFLDDIVPCSVPYTLDADQVAHAFDSYVPVEGKEISGYNDVVSIRIRCWNTVYSGSLLE